jgi:hypothetical protein
MVVLMTAPCALPHDATRLWALQRRDEPHTPIACHTWHEGHRAYARVALADTPITLPYAHPVATTLEFLQDGVPALLRELGFVSAETEAQA